VLFEFELLDPVPDLITIQAEQIRGTGLVPPAALQRLLNERMLPLFKVDAGCR